MISKDDILKMAKHVTRRGKNISDRKLLHPNREWVIGLSLFVVLTIAGAAYNALLFRHYSGIESTVTANELERTEYKQDVVTEALGKYDARAAAFETLYASYRAIPAPAATSTEEVVE